MNCFRYLDFKSFDEVDRLTIEEYNLLMKATELKLVDMDYRIHWQAYLNLKAKSETKTGKNKSKLTYDTFKKFYDYEDRVDKVLSPKKKSKFSNLINHLRKGDERDGR